MIKFTEHTWLLWWVAASVVLLRWFHQAYSHSHRDSDDASLRGDDNLPRYQDALFYRS